MPSASIRCLRTQPLQYFQQCLFVIIMVSIGLEDLLKQIEMNDEVSFE